MDSFLSQKDGVAYAKWFFSNQIGAKLNKNPKHSNHTKNDKQVSEHYVLKSHIKRLISIKLQWIVELKQQLL